MLHMQLADGSGFFQSSNTPLLRDGTQIEILLKVENSSGISYNFRLNKFERSTNSPDVIYTFDGYLDFPLYWMSAVSPSVQGSSSEAIRKIVESCGITYVDIDDTHEETPKGESTLVWQSSNMRCHQWVRNIAQYGYLDPNLSHRTHGLDLSGVFRYKEVSTLNTTLHKATLSTPEPGFILLTDVSVRGSPGSLNNYSTYSEAYLYQSIIGDPVYYDKTTSKAPGEMTKRLPNLDTFMTKNFFPSGSYSITRFSPISVGNFPAYAELSSHRNRKFSNVYSNTLEVVTPIQTTTLLLDRISLVLSERSPVYLFSGDYMISSKSIFVQGSNYVEKLELVRPTFYPA